MPRFRASLRHACIATLIVAAGSGLSSCKLVDKLQNSPTAPTPAGPPAASAAISYTAIGASDANGVGGSVQCAPFTACENGTGYVPLLARMLRTGREVTLLNLGIPAAVLSPTIYDLGRAAGRDIPGNFIVNEMPFVATGSTLVTIFAGGNDANALGDAIEKGANGSTELKTYIDTQLRAFGADYDRLVSGVRSRAPGAFIVIMNTPNMAALPYASGYTMLRRQGLQYISAGMSREANRQAASGVVVLDLMCDAQVYDRSRYAPDGFHPNDAGYAYLAQRLQAIVNGTASTAAASCGLMTVVTPL